jgi:hypothetical protein
MNIEMDKLEVQLLAAFRAKDWDKSTQVITIARDAQQLDEAEMELERRRSDFKSRIVRLNGKAAPVDFKGRIIQLRVTGGALRNSYLLVTRALADGLLKPDERLIVHVKATGETFQTTIYRRNKILWEREAIKRFYHASGVLPGCYATLEEIAPCEWNLTNSGNPGFTNLSRQTPAGPS